MLISVILCTYNGEKYLCELLDSLEAQTRKYDELIIADDNSSDKTKSIINNFAEHRTNVTIQHNKKGKGAARNFLEASLLAKGDIIFFCDQDDVWIKDKLEMMGKIMQENPRINMLASSLKPIYESNKKTIQSRLALEKQSSDGRIERVVTNAENFNIKRSGCTMCVRKKYLKKIWPMWVSGWYHDDFVWKCSVMDGSAAIYNYVTVKRRIHGSNTSISMQRSAQGRIKNIQDEIDFSKIAYSQVEDRDHAIQKELNRFIDFQNRRRRVVEKHSAFDFIHNVLFDPKLFRSRAQLLMDGVFLLKINTTVGKK